MSCVCVPMSLQGMLADSFDWLTDYTYIKKIWRWFQQS